MNILHPTPFKALLIASACSFGMLGCGGSESATPTDNPETLTNSASGSSNSETGEKTGAVSGSPARQTRRPNERWTDENGVEYLGNVPLDVFYDKPLEVASDMTPLAGGTVSGLPAATSLPMNPPADETTTSTTASTTEPAVVAATGSEDWGQLLPAEELLEEVNQIRNFLNSSLQSVGSYNNSMLSIPGKAASLAALAQVAIDHPQDISWKEDAIYIRDLAKQMTESNLQRGKKDQSRLLLLFENIIDTLNRSRPAGLEEPPEEDSFADVAEMRLLMMRMEEAERRLKTEAGSESAFSSKKEMVQHEAVILASLTKIVTLEGYGYSDDGEFKGYAQQIIEACETIRDAADTGTYSAYDLALSRISTNCQECHSVYKNN